MFTLIKRFFKKRKGKDELILTDQQFAILQRLSGYFYYRQQELKEQFPEIHEELAHFYSERGLNWSWSPSLEEVDKLEQIVNQNPELFQIEGSVGGPKEGTLYYTLLNLGIASTKDQHMIKRAKIMAERIDTQKDAGEDFLDELSKI